MTSNKITIPIITPRRLHHGGEGLARLASSSLSPRPGRASTWPGVFCVCCDIRGQFSYFRYIEIHKIYPGDVAKGAKHKPATFLSIETACVRTSLGPSLKVRILTA